MSYDHQAHRKLDELTEKIERLEEKLDRLADGLDISLAPAPISGAGSKAAPALPRYSVVKPDDYWR